MRSEAEIEADLIALGRPSFAGVEVTSLKQLNELRQRQLAWECANPDKARQLRALLNEARANEEANATERRRQVELERALATTRRIVGDRIADVLSRPDQTHAMGAAREWDSSSRWCLALLGGVGSGKSVAAGWLACQALARGDGVLFLRATEAATASLYGPEAQDRSMRARGARLLIIDDLGAEFSSDGWKSWLEDVLGARYANSGRTVLTTNLDVEGLRTRIGQRLVDRVREGTVYGVAGPSMRQRGER